MNPDHLTALATTHGRLVFHTAYRILGSVEAAEDVLQDVFLKLLKPDRRRPPETEVEDWGAYLRVLAAHRAIDLTRRKSTLSIDQDGGADSWMHEDQESAPDAVLDRREKARVLRTALRSLPPRDATLFALRYFEDLSYLEMARYLDLNENQVGVMLHRARRRLRVLLESGQAKENEEVGTPKGSQSLKEWT